MAENMKNSEINNVKISRNEETEKKKDLDLEKLIVKEIGPFGIFQAKINLICSIYVVFYAWSYNEYIFTTARIPTRCLIPECDGSSPEFSPSWIHNAIPGIDGNLDNCARYAVINSTFDSICHRTHFDTETTKICDEYVYENTDTAVYDLGLACDEWKRSFIGTARTLGVFISIPTYGYMSDRWGRRVTLGVGFFNSAWIGLTRYWANTYWGFLFSEIAEAIFGAGAYPCTHILVAELLEPKHRVIGLAITSSFYAIGQTTLGLLAWAIPNWRNLVLAIFIPQLLAAMPLYYVNIESIRWLMTKGRFEEGEKILKKAAKANNREVSDSTSRDLKECCEEEKKKKQKQNSIKEPWLPILVFRNKPVLLRTVTVPILWLTLTLVLYGLSLNAINLTGNKYFNYVAVAAVEIPGFWIGVLLMMKLGRKPALMSGYFICFLCMVGYIFISKDYKKLSLALYLTGNLSIAIVATSIYVYTAEIYPTSHRHTLLAFCSMIGRIGSMIAPLTPALAATVWTKMPFVLFGGFSLISGLLMMLLPETLGRKLPDTMEEAALLSGSKNK